MKGHVERYHLSKTSYHIQVGFSCVQGDLGRNLGLIFFFVLQSNSLLVPDSLRGTDKRRNGPEFSNDIKKRKVDDKDSSHYVSK